MTTVVDSVTRSGKRTILVEPREGLISEIPFLPVTDMNPDVLVIDGRCRSVGESSDLGDPPARWVESSSVPLLFTIIRRDTNCIEIDRVMRKVNRGDRDVYSYPTYLTLFESPPELPSGLPPIDKALNIATLSEMMVAGCLVSRELSQQTWEGLDRQIANPEGDAKNLGDVKDFGNHNVNSTEQDIGEYLPMMAWHLEFAAFHAGLTPVEWVIVMRPELWDELVVVWEKRHLLDANIEELLDVIDGQREFKDWLRDELKLPIGGRLYNVVLDCGIPEQNSLSNSLLSPGTFSSGIYFLPLIVGGGMPVLYWEYLDYRGPRARDLLASDNPSWDDDDLFWTDDGRLCWHLNRDMWSYNLSANVTCRVVLGTPPLAGRLDNVAYTPLQRLAVDG